MFKSIYINSFSNRLLLSICFIYCLNIFLGGWCSDVFNLQPYLVTHEMNFWRMVSFPLAPGSIEAVLLFFFTFLIIGPKLEEFIPFYLLPVMLILVNLAQGISYTLVFWETKIFFAGMEGLSFFVIGLYLFLSLTNRRLFRRFRAHRSNMFIAILLISWAASVYLHSVKADHSILVSSISQAASGIILSFIVFMQIKSIEFFKSMRKNRNKPANYEVPKPEELTLAIMSHNERKYNQLVYDDRYFREEQELNYTEENLNEILDKINEHGKESLTPDEIKFLKEYSKHI